MEWKNSMLPTGEFNIWSWCLKATPLHMYVRYYSNTVVAFRVRRLYVPGLIQLALKASIVGAATTVSPHYDRRGACSKENRGWHKTGTEGDRKYVFRWGKTHFGFRLWWHPSAGLAADLITATINWTRCGRAWKCRPEQRVSVRWLNDCYRWVYRQQWGLLKSWQQAFGGLPPMWTCTR